MIFAVRQFSITARRSPFGSASVRKPVDPMIMMSRMTACCSFSRRATRRDRTPLPELKWTMPAARAILDNRRFRQFVRAWFSTSTSTSATVISAEMRKTFSSWIADQEASRRRARKANVNGRVAATAALTITTAT